MAMYNNQVQANLCAILNVDLNGRHILHYMHCLVGSMPYCAKQIICIYCGKGGTCCAYFCIGFDSKQAVTSVIVHSAQLQNGIFCGNETGTHYSSQVSMYIHAVSWPAPLK